MGEAKLLGVECSDGEQCECCGTACPRRRWVLEMASGNVRRLGSTCASLSLRRSDVRRMGTAEAAARRWERVVRAAPGWPSAQYAVQAARVIGVNAEVILGGWWMWCPITRQRREWVTAAAV